MNENKRIIDNLKNNIKILEADIKNKKIQIEHLKVELRRYQQVKTKKNNQKKTKS